MGTIRVLVGVKSDALARVIRHVLHGEAGISGIEFADSGLRLMEQAKRLRPGLIIVNSRLLGRGAGAALIKLKRASPQSKLILTCDLEEIRRPPASAIVDVRVLDEALVRRLPAIVKNSIF